MRRYRRAIGAVALVLAAMLAAPVGAQGTLTARIALMQVAPAPALPAAATATPTARRHHARGDPLEGFNRAMYKVFKVLDRFFYRPVSIAYRKVIPKIVRGGIRHVFSNAGEPIVFVNDLLQLKPKRALRTFGRFTINSTIGIGGLVDVARTDDFKLPHRENGFGNTLGRYGVGPGPYLFLPFVGPSNFRDVLGDAADGIVLPYAVGSPFDDPRFQIPKSVITGLDRRAESDAELRALEAGAVDPYATLRSAYLQDRAAAVADLRKGEDAPPSAFDDPLTDPAEGTAAKPAEGGASTPPAMEDPLTDPAAMPAPVPAPATVPTP